ncbi:TraR/DksA family transcriptional regulator [Testudinibacter sp. P27/CKL/0425]
MTDLFDRASKIEQQQRDLAIAKHRQQHGKVSAIYCEDCDEPIPELRRQTIVGCSRCVTCQQIIEHKSKGYRR